MALTGTAARWGTNRGKNLELHGHCHQGAAVSLQAHERSCRRGWGKRQLPEDLAGAHHERPVLRRRDDAGAGAEPFESGGNGADHGDVRRGKAEMLAVFPSIFKVEHIRHEDMVEVLSGHSISVEFDRPTPIQIDGETIPGVSGYSATGTCEPVGV